MLSDDPLFFIINSYTTGLAPSVLTCLLDSVVTPRFGGGTVSDELGLPVTDSGLVLPCGANRALDKRGQSMTEAIRTEHLKFSYDAQSESGGVMVFDDLNLSI